MATTKEILEREHENRASIFLYKEGMFWKAYQKSAFLVHKIEPSFKIKKLFVKTVNTDIVSLGFPEGALKRLFQAENIETVNEKLLRIKSEAPDEAEYQEWFKAQTLSEPRAAVASPPLQPHSNHIEASVIRKIREFPMEGSTPIDCMMFLASIRKELISDGHL